MDATLGLAFTQTGWLYPFFAALLGWLGVALTGSDTSSNALFGSLQKITAEQLGAAARLLMAAANSTGGVMGKMIDAQSIVVAVAATQWPGRRDPALRLLPQLAPPALVGVLVMRRPTCNPFTAMVPDVVQAVRPRTGAAGSPGGARFRTSTRGKR